MALKSAKVVEFHPSSKPREGTPTSSEEDQGFSDSDYDPLVSGLILPMTMPIELLIPGMEKRVSLKALLDSGCIRCLISLTLAGNLGLHQRRPKNLISFCQLDWSVTGGIPATLAMNPWA